MLGAGEADYTFGWDNKHVGARILLSKVSTYNQNNTFYSLFIWHFFSCLGSILFINQVGLNQNLV